MTKEFETFESRTIKLPVSGDDLKIEMTKEFLDRIRSQFKIGSDEKVHDDYVRMFLHGAISSALEKNSKDEKIE